MNLKNSFNFNSFALNTLIEVFIDQNQINLLFFRIKFVMKTNILFKFF